ncbi:hypothetical protein GCM10010357_20900 [Streptomyces luteireticuli]|uniref:GntR family transcriptional regulator n=1 Tax=Streptomyces luteireticuli TaxID=173858 RepID=A0ABP3IEY4_9ACTN
MQTYGVARNTARNAVRFLLDEGYVYTVPQCGTYVRNQSDAPKVNWLPCTCR